MRERPGALVKPPGVTSIEAAPGPLRDRGELDRYLDRLDMQRRVEAERRALLLQEGAPDGR